MLTFYIRYVEMAFKGTKKKKNVCVCIYINLNYFAIPAFVLMVLTLLQKNIEKKNWKLTAAI